MSVRLAPVPREADPTTFDAHVSPDLSCLQGHFDGDPILAGVSQIDELVLAPARTLWPELLSVRCFRKLRFRAPIRPGDDLVVRLSRPNPAEVAFEITRSEAICSAGLVSFAEPTIP